MVRAVFRWLKGLRIQFSAAKPERDQLLILFVLPAARLWFEFLKRVAILTALKIASAHSSIAVIAYWVSLILIVLPLHPYLERYELDLRLTEDANGERLNWANPVTLGILWSCVTTIAGIALNFFVLGLTRSLELR
jgi:hypothetical protein